MINLADLAFVISTDKKGVDLVKQLASQLDLHNITTTDQFESWDIEAISGTGTNAKLVIIEIKKRYDDLNTAQQFGPYLMFNKFLRIREKVDNSVEQITPLFFNFSKDGLLVFEIKGENHYQWKNLLLPIGQMPSKFGKNKVQKTTEQYHPIITIRKPLY